MPTVKSCFKINEYKRLSTSCYKYLAKTFDTLIKTISMLSCVAENPHPTFVASYVRT